MDEELLAIAETSNELMRHSVAKLALGTIAGFLAGKAVEKGYDAGLKWYRGRNAN